MKPSLGRIVHYREANEVYAAMIVHVHTAKDPEKNVDFDREGRTNIVFWDSMGSQHVRDMVPIAINETTAEGCWHWPHRV